MNFWTVDAFTNEPFKGNPAGVCLLEKFPPTDLMQKIAAEINLSETVFVVAKTNGHYDVRWFTPTIEVELCGHATLAAAHILWNELNVEGKTLYFDSHSGVLMAEQTEEGITLNFPAYLSDPMAIPDGLAESLGVAPVCVSKAHDDCLVELHTIEEVINLQPDIAGLNQIDCRGIIITADGDSDSSYDFVSRFFAPRVGISEDAVTGSAHCKLAPYWAERLGRNELIAYQASKRGGIIKVRYDHNRVYLTGQAITIFKGKFLNLKDI